MKSDNDNYAIINKLIISSQNVGIIDRKLTKFEQNFSKYQLSPCFFGVSPHSTIGMVAHKYTPSVE